jgi:hypothetical protein
VVLGAFRGCEQVHVCDPDRLRAAGRLERERDEPVAAQKPRLGLRHVALSDELLDARVGPRPLDRTEPGLLVLAHEEPVEVLGARLRATGFDRLVPIVVCVPAACHHKPEGEQHRESEPSNALHRRLSLPDPACHSRGPA